MAINTGKVLAGGLAGGVVLGLLDGLVNGVLMADQNMEALSALNPALAANAESAAVTATFIGVDLVLGVLIAWTYAAMRPRFGPGPRTATFAGIQVWLVAVLMYLGMTVMGMWNWSYFAIGTALYFVMMIGAANVAGAIYKEG